jgi:hypothetical protein
MSNNDYLHGVMIARCRLKIELENGDRIPLDYDPKCNGKSRVEAAGTQPAQATGALKQSSG